MKILFISDTHYGLKSGGLDRTAEVHDIMNRAVNLAIERGVDLFVHGGDIGHISNPSSYIHGLWVDIFLKLEGAGIESRFLLGNHDAIHRSGYLYGSLAPLVELDLKHVRAVVERDYEWFGDSFVVYLPFVSRANTPGGLSVNEYYENFVYSMREEKTFDEAKGGVVAFTHLNPSGAEVHDDFILRPVEAVVPSGLFDLDIDGVFSGHIHRPQELKTRGVPHWIVGAPIVTDFGDILEKRILLIDIDEDGLGVESIPSGAISLVQLEYDFVDHDGAIEFDFDPEIVNGAGIKVKIRLTEDQREMADLDALERELEKNGAAFVKKIIPTIVRRNDETVALVNSDMTDREAVDSWLEARKPSNASDVKERAYVALEESVR
jgi:DNA repair exonuclease SbcCD nuclease subunit